MPSPFQPLQPGDPHRIGPYRVIGRLGTGGMGTVYAAVDRSGLHLALKVVHPVLAGDEEFRARFRREVQLSRRVKGPCLVQLHDADTDSTAPWLATPFVPGPTLDQHLASQGPLAGAHLYALAAGTAAALAALHQAGIVHRDVKPQNVILAPSGPRVLDFGIAHALDGTSVTRTGVMTGTPGWISPEHYRTGEVGPQGDVFAWGALIAYAATGRLPFGNGAPDAVAFRVMSASPDLAGAPEELLPLLEQALSKDPGDRAAAGELSQVCTALLAAQATAAAPATDSPTLLTDLVAVHWDLPRQDEDTRAWHRAPHHKSPKIYFKVAVAALVVGSIGGAIAATAGSGPTSGQENAAAPHSSQTPDRPSTGITGSATSGGLPGRGGQTAPTTVPAEPALQAAPSPAYTRADSTQPTVEEWAQARVPATPTEKTADEEIRSDAAGVFRGLTYLDDDVIVTFNPQAQTMFVTFGPGSYTVEQDPDDDPDWIEVRRSLMFGSCSKAQQNFHDHITWPYGRVAIVYRESMASPTIADFRVATHSDACRV